MLLLEREYRAFAFDRDFVDRHLADRSGIASLNREWNRRSEAGLETQSHPLAPDPNLDVENGAMTANPPQRHRAPGVDDPGTDLKPPSSCVCPDAEQTRDNLLKKRLWLESQSRADPPEHPRRVEQITELGLSPIRLIPWVGPHPGGVASHRPGKGLIEGGLRRVEKWSPVQPW